MAVGNSPGFWTHLVISAVLANGISAGYLFLAFLLILGLSTLYEWRTNKFYPDSVVVTELLDVLHQVETHPERWGKLDFRRARMRQLENVADRLERELPHRLRSGDPLTDEWMNKATRRMAAALRAKKKWLLTPKPDTREHLIKALAAALVNTATGDWDGLEQADLEPVSRAQFVSQVGGLVWQLVQGALPLLVLLGIRRVEPAFAGPLADSAITGAVMWFALRLLAVIDPHYREKLAELKELPDILGKFPGGKR
jgi:hypothetical protein